MDLKLGLELVSILGTGIQFWGGFLMARALVPSIAGRFGKFRALLKAAFGGKFWAPPNTISQHLALTGLSLVFWGFAISLLASLLKLIYS